MFHSANVPPLSLINPFAFASFAENREKGVGGGVEVVREIVCVRVRACVRAALVSVCAFICPVVELYPPSP